MNSERIKSLSTEFKNERSTLNSNVFIVLIHFLATIKYQDFKTVLEKVFQ